MKIKLSGTNEQKIKQIEKILPRIASRMVQTREVIKPDSLIGFHTENVSSSGLIFSFCTFDCKIKKLCFSVLNMTGKEKPSYRCTIIQATGERVFTIQTKKTFFVQDINIEVSVGDIIKLEQVNIDLTNPKLENIHGTLLVSLNIDSSEKQIIQLDEISDEGI